MEQSNLKVGNIIEVKKNHPCGSNKWKILRLGVDFKLECVGCNHVILIERPKALKMIKKVYGGDYEKI